MADPVTIGGLVALALSLGGETVVKGAVGEAVKDAYKALKARVSLCAAKDVEELEDAPGSATPLTVIAHTVDCLSLEDKESLGNLAQALTDELKKQASTIGLDVGRFETLEAQLGDIVVTQGVGVRIRDARVSGTFRTGDISVGPPPGEA